MLKKVLLIYVVWFIVINIFAFYALHRFNLKADTAYSWIDPEKFYQNKDLNLINIRVHWDSFWYLKITQAGYEYKPGEMTSIAFFPLYPLSIWTLSQIPLINASLAGWIISSLSLGISLILLFKLTAEFHPEIDPIQPIILLLIFPTSFFLTSVYTESLFLMLSVIFFYLLFKKQYLMAAVFLSLSSICRINGLFLFVPLIYEYFRTYGIKKFFNLNLLSFIIAPFSFICFLIFQYLQFKEPCAFIKAQMEWGRKFVLNAEHFQLNSSASYANLATDLLFFITAIILGIILIKRIRVSYGLYVLATIILAVLTGTLMSLGRFIIVLFPIFILLASIKNNYFKFGWQLLSILLLAIFITLFVNNYWAG